MQIVKQKPSGTRNMTTADYRIESQPLLSGVDVKKDEDELGDKKRSTPCQSQICYQNLANRNKKRSYSQQESLDNIDYVEN